MKIGDFISPDVQYIVKATKTAIAGKALSDIIDGENHQYVDLVMEGGGVLGIALVGYTYLLEELGIRFMSIGGTSAGSINALLLAAMDLPHQKKSVKVLELLANLDMNSLVDGDNDAKDFIRAFVADAGKFRLAWKGMQILDNLEEDMGLNPGEVFLNWVSNSIKAAGIRSTRDLLDRINSLPETLTHRIDGLIPTEQRKCNFAVVSAEVTTETKVDFPRMAELYWNNPDSIDPSFYIRASMSIPFFFHPFKLSDLPSSPEIRKRWLELTGYPVQDSQPLPKTCVFMDGGIMSNFPIDLFHIPDKVPSAPTFGARLGLDDRLHTVTKPMELVGAIFNSARHCLDYDFLSKNPDYRKLVTFIDTKKHNWLNFDLTTADKVDLFACGVQAASDFIKSFDWEGYKKIRQGMASAHKASGRG